MNSIQSKISSMKTRLASQMSSPLDGPSKSPLHYEPQSEAMLLRALNSDIEELGDYIDPYTKSKLQKTINVRLLTILNDAAPK